MSNEKKDMNAFYSARLQKINEEINQYHRKISLFSWMRLLSFVLMIGMVYSFAAATNALFLGVAIFSLFVLVGLIIYHQRLYLRRAHLLVMAEINQNELNIITNETSIFDDGACFAQRLPFADDLDLFGKHSLFHSTNRATTSFGKEHLADSLLKTPTQADRIIKLQQAIKQIADKLDFNQEVMTVLLQAYREKEHREMLASRNAPQYLFGNKYYRIAAFVLPAFVIASFIFFLITGNIGLFLILGSVTIMIAFSLAKKMVLLSEELSGLGFALKAYGKVLQMFDKQSFSAEMLVSMQKTAGEASAELLKLSKLSEGFDQRSNILWYALGNVFLLSDIHLALAYEKWKKTQYLKIDNWLETVGKLEMLMSYGVYSFNHKEFCIPELSAEPELFATQLGHPMIPENKRVNNDIHLNIDPRLVLVTGSNMSGKSTWLRTLGVNVLLAQAGAPVCATTFRWKPMPVLSSLRQTDSLHENTSLFMHELLQLKAILDKAETGEMCLILLDEVLRGTNSDDKYTGSYALIERLVKYNSLTVMATHDLKLSALEQKYEGKIVNQCFESTIVEAQLLFDYTLKKGVAVNRNATWLMQELGII